MAKPKTPLQLLNDMEQQAAWDKFPDAPREYIVRLPNKASNANSLTKSIIKFLQLSGHQAERISVEGRVIDTRQTYTDVLGQTKTTGTFKRIPSSATKGSADIGSTIKKTYHKGTPYEVTTGVSVKIEVKWGKDRLSEAQRTYSANVKRAEGEYWVVHTFDEFYDKYQQFING